MVATNYELISSNNSTPTSPTKLVSSGSGSGTANNSTTQTSNFSASPLKLTSIRSYLLTNKENSSVDLPFNSNNNNNTTNNIVLNDSDTTNKNKVIIYFWFFVLLFNEI